MRRFGLGAIGILGTLLLLRPGAAQQPPGEAAAFIISPRDSAALVAAGRADQAAFERLRRRHFPPTWGGGSMRCDERIGRFCLNYRGGQDDWEAPPEVEDVVNGRLTLIEGLGQAAQLIPGDRWIAGQRVRYLVEARRFGEAVAAARECRAEAWWCAALAGFAFHHSARAVQADSAFAVALDHMTAERRRRWTDLSFILDDRTVRVYRRLEGEERDALEARFWYFADPLLTRPGNELQAEHFTRQVWSELQDRAESTEGLSWGYDLHEILIRFGWPNGWEQVREFGMPMSGRPSLVSHYSSSPQPLLPPSGPILGELETGIWNSDDHRPRAGYTVLLADSTARWISPLLHQVAVFNRGDSAIVVAGYELPRDSIPEGVPIESAVALLPSGEISPVMIAVADPAGTSGSMMLKTAATPALLAIEVVVPTEKRVARVRYGLDLAPTPPGLLTLSDLLLIQSDAELPDSLHTAVEAARGSIRVAPNEQIGIYWEVYGVDPLSTPALTMSLRLLEPRQGWLRRLGERAGLLREAVPIQLRWEEAVTSGPYLPRSIHIDVPAVAPGSYLIELTVEAPGREGLSVRKEIEVWPI